MESIRWAFNFSSWKPTKEQWILAARCIQKEEKERIGRFVFAKDSKAAMAGRLLIRKLMVEKIEIANEVLELGRTDHDKPYLKNEISNDCIPALSFNVSHQGSYSVLAAEPDRPVGVDVMKVEYTGGKPVPDFFRLMNRNFSNDEWQTILSGSTEQEQLYYFYRHWCLKESYVKAVGVGISFSLQRLSFLLHEKSLTNGAITASTHLKIDGCWASNWTFEETMLDNEHCVAVALGPKLTNHKVLTKQPSSAHFTVLQFDDLLRNVHPIHPADEDYWHTFSRKQEKSA